MPSGGVLVTRALGEFLDGRARAARGTAAAASREVFGDERVEGRLALEVTLDEVDAAVVASGHGTAVAKAMQADEHRLARFLFADVPSGDVGAFAGMLDHVVGRLRDPRFGRLRRSALKRWPSRRSA
jgi:hypothetical protein